ncbi:MAG: hypothetical protein Q8O62_04500 [Aequorivita sp.]|nr:hypothetical protein [Aequorivita sp.]
MKNLLKKLDELLSQQSEMVKTNSVFKQQQITKMQEMIKPSEQPNKH